jgi:hypothetical protein
MRRHQLSVIRLDYTRRDSIVFEHIKYAIVPAGYGSFDVFFQCIDSGIPLIFLGRHKLGKLDLALVHLGQLSELVPREIAVCRMDHEFLSIRCRYFTLLG